MIIKANNVAATFAAALPTAPSQTADTPSNHENGETLTEVEVVEKMGAAAALITDEIHNFHWYYAVRRRHSHCD